MGTKINAIMVSVDYTDILSLTLPLNRHHFNTVTIVTTAKDFPNLEQLVSDNKCSVHMTDSFYANGAKFNKWLALEEALDKHNLRRPGWLCLMDADVIWPHTTDIDMILRPGFLYTPRRRIVDPIPAKLPHEIDWSLWPLHQNESEFAGYTQIFHTTDPILGDAPWHQTDWVHAGGADSFFQAKWPLHLKVRPGWQVLHLGPPGVNWCGRASAYLDGAMPVEAEARREELHTMLVKRRTCGPGMERYAHERLPKPPNG